MRPKLFTWMLLLYMSAVASQGEAQNLIIKLKDGSESSKPIESVQKLSFANGNLQLKDYNGSTDVFNLSTINTIRFKPSSSGIDHSSVTFNEISVYPNPADDFISLRGMPAGSSTVTIFRMDGTLVLQTRVSSDVGSVDIRNLSKGLYLAKINGKSFKFIKL